MLVQAPGVEEGGSGNGIADRKEVECRSIYSKVQDLGRGLYQGFIGREGQPAHLWQKEGLKLKPQA